MKEITYSKFEDYIEKSKAYDDPKVIKVYNVINFVPAQCKAVTFMRTWLLQWIGDSSYEILKALKEANHKEGKILDIVPLGRAI